MPTSSIPYPFGKCGVCDAQATGKHYGAATCEACKGFFKRTLVNRRIYRCEGTNGSCLPYTQGKNAATKCKACRFKRCLRIGMSMSGIKMGRIPKAAKLLALRQAGLLPGNPCENKVSSQSENSAGARIHSACNSMSCEDPEDAQEKCSVFGALPTEHAATKLSVIAHRFRKLEFISDQARRSFPPSFRGAISDKPTESNDRCELAVEDEISQRDAACDAVRTEGNAESSEASSNLSGGTASTQSCPLCVHPVASVIDLKQATLGAACSTATCAAGVCPFCGLSSSRGSSILTLIQMDYSEIITCIANAFSQFTREHRREITLMDARLSRGRSASDDAMPVTPENKVKATAMVLDKLDILCKDFAGFANACPGFSTLPMSDRKALIEAAFVGLWLISRSSVFVNGDIHLVFADNSCHCRSWFKEFVPEVAIDKMQAYAERQNAALLSVRELGLMCAITLFSDHDVGLACPEVVSHIREHYIKALVHEVNESRVESSSVLADIGDLLQLVEQLIRDRSSVVGHVLDT